MYEYKSGSKCVTVTPSRKKAIESLGRRSYKAAATNIASGNKTKAYIVHSVAYLIRQEMANICSIRHPSLLRDSHSAVKKFNWQAILSEFSLKLPTLILLLRKMLSKSDKFISFVISLLIKKRCKHMSLLQRVISVLLYGNGTNKEVGTVISILILDLLFNVGLQLFITFYGMHVTSGHIWID